MWSRILKSSGAPAPDVMAVAQHGGDLADGQRDILRRAGGNPHVIQVGETHQLGRVRRLAGGLRRIQRRLLAGINLAARIGRTSRGRSPGDCVACLCPVTRNLIVVSGARRKSS